MYLVETVYGSRLFGTALPTSDMDIKRIFVCDMKDLVFGRTSTRNNVDIRNGVKFETEEHYIAAFCRMVEEGQTLAYSMMFTPPEFTTHTTSAWEELIANRSRLVSKNLKPFVGYARSQAQKYSLKGERLRTLGNFIEDIQRHLGEPFGNTSQRHLGEPFGITPEGRMLPHYFELLCKHYEGSEGIRLHTELTANQAIRHIEVCGKSFGETTPLKLWLKPLLQLRNQYGKRSMQSKEDNGSDLKALYHAVRITSEMNEILRTGNLTYPRPEASLLLDIRRGKLTNGEIATLIDNSIAEGDRLFGISSLRDTPDTEWLDDWSLRVQAYVAVSSWTDEKSLK